MISRFHSTDTTPKNNIEINSTSKNHIIIINNIFNRQKKESSQSKKNNLKKIKSSSSNKSVKFIKDVFNISTSLIYELDTLKIREKNLKNQKNKLLFLNENLEK